MKPKAPPAAPRPKHRDMKPKQQTLSKLHSASTQNQTKPVKPNVHFHTGNTLWTTNAGSAASVTKIRFLCDPCLWRWESFLQTISSGTIWSTSAARALLFHCVFICRGLMCSTSFGSHVGGSCVYGEPLKAHLQHWWPHSCSLHGNLEPSSKQRRNINKLWRFWCKKTLKNTKGMYSLNLSSRIKPLWQLHKQTLFMLSPAIDGLTRPGAAGPACLCWKKIPLTCKGCPPEVYYVCMSLFSDEL